MAIPQPDDGQFDDRRLLKDSARRADAALHVRGLPAPGAYAVVFVDDTGSPESVVATFPGPMSAEMYGKIAGGRFRVVELDAAPEER